MKNLPLILSIVLLVAVAVLFFLHFKPSGDAGSSETAGSTEFKGGKIAFIRTDTLMKYSEFVKKSQKTLQDKSEKLQLELQNRAMGLEKEINNYQRSRGNLTISQDRALAEDLTNKQRNLQMYEQSLSQDLMSEQAKLTEEVYNDLTSFLKKYSEERGIEVVLKFDPSSDMLYGADVLDITKDVITGLNEQFKTGGTVSADSTATK